MNLQPPAFPRICTGCRKTWREPLAIAAEARGICKNCGKANLEITPDDDLATFIDKKTDIERVVAIVIEREVHCMVHGEYYAPAGREPVEKMGIEGIIDA